MGIRLDHHFPREFPIRVPGQQLWRGTLEYGDFFGQFLTFDL